MNETDEKTLSEIFSSHNTAKDELISVMQAAQEKFGYLPPEVMERIASHFRVAPGIVYGVATFYAQFKFIPTGKRMVRVCRGTACHVRGSSAILKEVEKNLGIKPGETSPDLENSLETTACFGSCALAPVMVVNKDFYGRMTPRKAEQVLKETEKSD